MSFIKRLYPSRAFIHTASKFIFFAFFSQLKVELDFFTKLTARRSRKQDF